MCTGHSFTAALMVSAAFLTAGEIGAQTVTPAVKHDVSPALSSLPTAAARPEAAFKKIHRVFPMWHLITCSRSFRYSNARLRELGWRPAQPADVALEYTVRSYPAPAN